MLASSEMKNKFSVVIPAYNAEDTILEALNSIKNQDSLFAIKEIIVVDDGSKDKTVGAVESFMKKNPSLNVILIRIPNSGPSKARNAGIQRASSEWIAFLDSDDKWNFNKITLQLSVIERNPGCTFVSGSSNLIKGGYGKHLYDNVYKISVLQYLYKSRVSTPTVVALKASIEEAGLYSEHMRYAEDENLFMKLIHDGGAYYINDELVHLNDKPVYGTSGLSANLRSMHKGRVLNIKESKSLGYINFSTYVLLIVVERIKYARRIIKTKLRKLNKKDGANK